MKKLLSILTMTLMCSTIGIYAEESNATLPLKQVFEGSSITWIEDEVPQINVKTSIVDYVFTIGKNDFTANGKNYSLSDKVVLVEDTTYMSLDIVDLAKDIENYQYGILDAIQSDNDELLPLVTLDPNVKSKATWKDGMVKVASWHRSPDTYISSSDVTTDFGEVWVFTEDEIKDWARGEQNITSRRLEQLIGLVPQSNYTHFSVMYVKPEDLFRPSADPEINDALAQINFADGVSKAHKDWYNANIIYSYSVKYPWTRLGYTYDWNPESDEYGLSEFIIKQGSTIKVENTYTTDEFICYLKN